LNLHGSKQSIYNLIFAIGLIIGFAFVKNTAHTINVSSPNVSGKKIIIDAGHGSPDGGAVGSSGVFEKDLNLSVAKKLGSLLQKSGAYVVYTRETDECIAPDKSLSIAEVKRADMKKRKEIRDSSNADLFVSIHMNKFADSSQNGAQVFYAKNPLQSKALAQNIQKHLKNNINPKNNRHIKESDGSIYILNNAQIPCVLVECGFLSNPHEEKLLCLDEYRQNIAFAIYSGIVEYIN